MKVPRNYRFDDLRRNASFAESMVQVHYEKVGSNYFGEPKFLFCVFERL